MSDYYFTRHIIRESIYVYEKIQKYAYFKVKN